MSYILDALKKADADRDRQVSAVPDLHAQADTAARLALAQPRAARWWGLALGAVVVILAGAAWLWLGPSDDAPAAPLAAAAPPATLPIAQPAVVAPAPAPAPRLPPTFASPTMPPNATQGATTPPAGMTQPRPQALPQSLPPPAPVTRPPERRAEAVSRARAPLPAPPTQAPVQAPAQAPAQAQAQTPGAQPAAAQPSRLPTFAELPPTLRGQLPPLSVGGSVYSRTPASRMVILNGQVFREGDRPIDGLSVDEIRLKSSVLSFRGTRFELPH